jgi:hypothetical protein
VVDTVKVVPAYWLPEGEILTDPPVGTDAETVTSLEKAAVDPEALLAVTLQRIGLT